MTIYPMTPEQKLENARAMLAWAKGEPVQYWSDSLKQWCDCLGDGYAVDCEFPHRPKPKEEISTRVEDY